MLSVRVGVFYGRVQESNRPSDRQPLFGAVVLRTQDNFPRVTVPLGSCIDTCKATLQVGPAPWSRQVKHRYLLALTLNPFLRTHHPLDLVHSCTDSCQLNPACLAFGV